MLHKTNLDLPEETRKKSIELLQVTLSSMLDLTLQAKQAHWNVKGMNFIALHDLFDKLYEKLNELTDMTAERITALSSDAFGSVQQINKETILTAYPNNIHSGKEHLESLSSATAKICKYVRESIEKTSDNGDMGTSDLFTELSRDLDQYLWFLEAHLQ
ncbi:MAG: DNA starvation/stationary phase protection protein Dps [Zetaproteobacteria bacterium]|nr:DNA starvation/stationary phase protection protein Dps [Pseudobdellovibrionaceae bacterium]